MDGPQVTVPDRDTLIRWLREMVVIRRVEELAQGAYQQRKIRGFLHLCIGQEAIAVAGMAALRKDDVVVTGYRDHGIAIGRGIPARAVMAELFGKATGTTRGQGGSMHMASAEHHLFGGYGIVGGHVTLGAGAALAFKYREELRVAVSLYGDGASTQGAVFESLALAQLWNLPAVFICENNLYAMGTSVERSSFLTEMHRRADGVGMVNWRFDAFDPVVTWQELGRAMEHARSGKGPVLVEAMCYRYRGHSMSDPGKYRTAEEVAEYRKRDGILLLEARLTGMGVESAALRAVHDEAEAIAQEALSFAETSPEPDPAELYDFTYAEAP